MTTRNRPQFTGGLNIAIKVPASRYDKTVAFYRDTLGLAVAKEEDDSMAFEFGTQRLWVDRVRNYSRSDVWLEVNTPDPDAACGYLAEHGVATRDELEPLGDLDAHWVSDPSGTVLLVIPRGD